MSPRGRAAPVRQAGAAAGVLVLVAGAGCPLPPESPQPSSTALRLVVAERGPAGGRLVVVHEDGKRGSTLVPPSGETVRDVSPAFSPDGQWIAFASSRGRPFEETSVWITRARAGAEPIQLTTGPAVDLWPVWTPEGDALVFASTRDGDLDLWRLAVRLDGDTAAAVGEPERLTDLAGEEAAPAVGPDGRIAFSHIAHDDAGTRSRIAVRARDGAITYLTEGPADTSPAWTPDGARVVFAAPHVRSAEPPRVDGDLWAVDAGGGAPELILDVDVTDESGPAWSRDGRWLFASSLFRGADGEARFAAVIYRDTAQAVDMARMLVDPAGAVPRLSVAVGPGPLDARALLRGPRYADELAAILRRALDDAAP